MAIYKKEKKRAAQTHLTQEKAEFLVKLMETTFSKLRYFSDEEWGGDDDDDDDGEDEVVTAFLDMRKVGCFVPWHACAHANNIPYRISKHCLMQLPGSILTFSRTACGNSSSPRSTQ